jgi:integrase
MATIEKDAASGIYRVRFRYGGQQFNRSLKLKDERKAANAAGRIEEFLGLIEAGHVTVPDDVDAGRFIISGGKQTEKPKAPQAASVGEVCRRYLESMIDGTKSVNTVEGEKIHIEHLKRHLGERTPFRSLDRSKLADYVRGRQRDIYRGRAISGGTIKKELTTFRQIWSFAVGEALARGDCPSRDVAVPRPKQRPPFRTREEIERLIARGGLTKDQEEELWECLFLRSSEVLSLLAHVKKTAEHSYVYPMFALAALTGARRSEVMRAQVIDLDLTANAVLLRETKRDHTSALTFRHIPLHPQLRTVMEAWLAEHPGGAYLIQKPLDVPRGGKRDAFEPLSVHAAHNQFKRALVDSEWEIVRGFHVLRHSFASNLAAAKVHQSIIDRFMGHQTEEQRKRYRHLFPREGEQAINALTGHTLDAAFSSGGPAGSSA